MAFLTPDEKTVSKIGFADVNFLTQYSPTPCDKKYNLKHQKKKQKKKKLQD